jgi:hypothetical protein
VLLALVGFSLVLRGQYWTAALVAAVGPIVHEGFIFMWSPIAVLLVWSAATFKVDRAAKVCAAALPLLSALIVTSAHNEAALAMSMHAWPAGEDVKSGVMGYTFAQTLPSSFEHMRRFEFQGHWNNFFVTVGFFLVPNVLLLWIALFCYWSRWTMRWPTLLVTIVGMLAPLSIVALAWDLSRFLTWSNLGAAIMLIGAGSPAIVAARSHHA